MLNLNYYYIYKVWQILNWTFIVIQSKLDRCVLTFDFNFNIYIIIIILLKNIIINIMLSTFINIIYYKIIIKQLYISTLLRWPIISVTNDYSIIVNTVIISDFSINHFTSHKKIIFYIYLLSSFFVDNAFFTTRATVYFYTNDWLNFKDSIRGLI